MTFVYFILFIGVLIFVHEMGHFIFAKLFDVKVLKFSLGFGPRALGFRRGETEYCVAWVPLGGYVRMLGEDPNDDIRTEDQGRAFHQKPLWQRYIVVLAGPTFNLIFPIIIYFFFYAAQDSLLPSTVGTVFAGQPAAQAGLEPGDRITSIAGKPVRYWEDLQTIVSEHPAERMRFTIERNGKSFDRFITPREEVSRNWLKMSQRYGRIGVSPYFKPPLIGISDTSSPAHKAGLRNGDLVTSVNGSVVELWAELEQVLRRNRGQSLRVTFLRPKRSSSRFVDFHEVTPKTVVVVPPPGAGRQGEGLAWMGIHSAEFFVRNVEKGSPAESIGIKKGDQVVRFNGKPVHHWDQIFLALKAKKEAKHSISWITPATATAWARGERAACETKAECTGCRSCVKKTKRDCPDCRSCLNKGIEDCSVACRVCLAGKWCGPCSGDFKLAKVTFTDDYKQEHKRYVFGVENYRIWKSADNAPIEGRFTYAVSKSVRQTGEIIGMIGLAIVQIIRGAIPSDTIGGPIMLAHTARVAAEKGWDHFLRMLALISINLGILNLLPIPILDGGHILFFTVEAVKRKQVSLRVREIATYVGLALLLSLMIFAFKNDIVRYWFK